MSNRANHGSGITLSSETITPAQLRQLAEAADGGRHEEQVVIRRPDGSIRLTSDVSSIKPDDTVLLRISGTDEGHKPPDNFSLVMRLDGAERELRGRYDSLFWSVSALRKFALPYYMSYDETAEKCQMLLSRFKNDPAMVAIAHSPSSDPTRIYGGGSHIVDDPFPGLEALVAADGALKSTGPIGRRLG